MFVLPRYDSPEIRSIWIATAQNSFVYIGSEQTQSSQWASEYTGRRSGQCGPYLSPKVQDNSTTSGFFSAKQTKSNVTHHEKNTPHHDTVQPTHK